MPIRLTAAVCGALMLCATPALAQERSTIAVTGIGRVEAAPDTFTVAAEIIGQGPDQTQAILAMTRTQTAVSDAVVRLNGLTSADLTTGLPSVEPLYEPDCARTMSRAGGCAVTGYLARIPLSLRAQPAERGGDAVALAAEKGAIGARLDGVSLADQTALRRQAAAAAYADARRQADVIAEAAGQRVVGLVRVEGPAEDRRISVYGANAEVDANFGWADASTPIVLAPDSIKVDSRLTVTFAIE